MTVSESVYKALTGVAAPLARAAVGLGTLLPGATESKSYRGLAGVLGGAAGLEGWAARERDSSRPLVWFHAPSVGEGLQARAVMQEMRRLRPDLQLVYTYFSPSAIPFAGGVPADYTGYIPLDAASTVRRVLDRVQPAAIVFSKNEVWPNLTREATRCGTPVLLLSATLPAKSSRMRGPAATLLAAAHARLATVGAISADDATRYRAFGVRPDRLFVMGDARFDQVRERMRRVDREGPLLRSLRNDRTTTLVAGSTWPADEEVLLPTVASLGDSGVRLRVIAAPHEPTEDALQSFEREAGRLGLRTLRLARLLELRGVDPAGAYHQGGDGAEPGAGSEVGDGPNDPDIILIDRVGILGDLYAAGDMAYVGGGFGSAGLHSVLEPAAFGIPIAFGPHHENAREAADLVERGGGVSVPGALELIEMLWRWATDETVRREAGARATAYVEENLGAAERGARALLGFIPEEDGR